MLILTIIHIYILFIIIWFSRLFPQVWNLDSDIRTRLTSWNITRSFFKPSILIMCNYICNFSVDYIFRYLVLIVEVLFSVGITKPCDSSGWQPISYSHSKHAMGRDTAFLCSIAIWWIRTSSYGRGLCQHSRASLADS